MSERYTWEIRETKLGEAQVVVDNTKEDCWYGAAMSICEILNCKEERIKELEEENEQLRTQLVICQQSKSDDGRIKMKSEKRFTLDDRGYDGFDIYDSTGEYKESELFIGMSLQQIVDCLNKLNDENEEYAKIIEQSKRYEDGLWVRFTKLEKENEELRQEIERLKKELDEKCP